MRKTNIRIENGYEFQKRVRPDCACAPSQKWPWARPKHRDRSTEAAERRSSQPPTIWTPQESANSSKAESYCRRSHCQQALSGTWKENFLPGSARASRAAELTSTRLPSPFAEGVCVNKASIMARKLKTLVLFVQILGFSVLRKLRSKFIYF